MPYNPDIHYRRSIRLKVHDYSQSGLYFAGVALKVKYYKVHHQQAP